MEMQRRGVLDEIEGVEVIRSVWRGVGDALRLVEAKEKGWKRSGMMEWRWEGIGEERM